MNELEEFRKWAKDIGHWRVVAAIDRYLVIQEKNKQKGKTS